MNIYPDKSAVEITVDLTDIDGNPITNIKAVSYCIVDEENNELLPEIEYDFGENDKTFIQIVVPEEVNTLKEGCARDIRIICVRIEKESGGGIVIEQAYGVSVQDPLKVGENSFMTYRQFLRLSMDMPEMPNWERASTNQRISALMEARTRICRLAFDLPQEELDMTKQEYEVQAADHPRTVPWNTTSIHIKNLSEADFEKLPEGFKKALCMAQLAESNDILETDSISERRRQGLILETIGEVKQMFSSMLPAQTAISSKSMSYLSPYLASNRRIGRA